MNKILNSVEYVTVNENQDLWQIDFDQGLARYTNTVTLEDLEVNSEEWTDLGTHDIRSYLESNGYIVDEDQSTETWIEFKKVSA